MLTGDSTSPYIPEGIVVSDRGARSADCRQHPNKLLERKDLRYRTTHDEGKLETFQKAHSAIVTATPLTSVF